MGTDTEDELVGVDGETSISTTVIQAAGPSGGFNSGPRISGIKRRGRRGTGRTHGPSTRPAAHHRRGRVRAVGYLSSISPGDLNAISHKLEGQSEEPIADQTVRLVADLVARTAWPCSSGSERPSVRVAPRMARSRRSRPCRAEESRLSSSTTNPLTREGRTSTEMACGAGSNPDPTHRRAHPTKPWTAASSTWHCGPH